MSERATVLLVGEDGAGITAFRTAVGRDARWRLLIAPDAASALRIAAAESPDLIVLAHHESGPNGLDLCRRLRELPAIAGASVVLVVDAGAGESLRAGETYGVDDHLTRPLAPAAIEVRLRAVWRQRTLAAERHRAESEAAALRKAMAGHFERTLSLLREMLAMRLPGSAERGARVAERALQVAARFGVPDEHLPDLDIAARLHELGRMLSPDPMTQPATAPASSLAHWHHLASTHALFVKLPGLEGAAELIEGFCENWDGTGHPHHRQQGQIPLRSRILRAVVDFFDTLAASGGTATEPVLDELQSHAGTRYDPMVLVHLRAVLQGALDGDVQGDRRVLPVPALEVGMVLAEDLLTPAGVKLLARDTRLTQPTLDLILRRHADDPMVQGAVVRRT